MSHPKTPGLGSIAAAEGMVGNTKAPTGQELLTRLLRAQGNAGYIGKPPHPGRVSITSDAAEARHG